MKMAVLSDVHDNLWNLDKVIGKIKDEKIDAMIFCGDMCAPPAFRKLAEINLPLYMVFGNVDGAQKEITHLASTKYDNVVLEKEILEIEIDSKKIAVCHNNIFAEGLASTGKYEIVFHGHTHKVRNEKIGKTIIANPGEVHGYKTGKCTFGIFDTKKNEFEIKEVT